MADKDLSKYASSLLASLGAEPASTKKSAKVRMAMADFSGQEKRPNQGPPSLVKSITNLLNGSDDSIERLAFEVDPSMNHTFMSLYQPKTRLLPDEVLKRIAIQDDLVASIVTARSNMAASFGRPQPDRYSTGYKIEPEPGLMEKLSEQEREELQKRIARAELRLLTCGKTTGYSDQDVVTFSQFLYMSARNAVVFGRIATEAIYAQGMDGKKFHSFRPIDSGTIYKAAPLQEAAQSVRDQARHLLEQLKNKRLEPERFENDEYTWVQVINGRPVQAFTSEECLVHNFFPTTDVELSGYPITPLDTVISAVTTHINITNHNKLYFQNGRAARGMIVIKSDDVDDGVIKHVRQQFQASINNVSNAWRTPIFGIGTDDDISWFPTDNSSRDMEFQYLSDANARTILSAFSMSPEELPGYTHLSRGTNSQALSESNGEYKLTAARDVGLRPLLAGLQAFVNQFIIPLIDEELSKKCAFKFVGLDAVTAEKESAQLQGDMQVHMTYDEVLERVEKKVLGAEWGGKFPLNPAIQAVMDKYVPQGLIMEHFFGMKGASKDPRYDFLNNPNYFSNLQILQEQQQAQMAQQQQAQMAQQQPPGGSDGGGGEQPQGDGGGQPEEKGDLTRSIDQLANLLQKSEASLPQGKRRMLAQQRKFVERALAGFEADSKDVIKEILDVAEQHKPKE